MPKFSIAATGCVVLLFLLCGTACRSDNTDNAVEKARAYALERTRDLTEPQRNYIRYATPDIWENVLFPYFSLRFEEYAHLTRNFDEDSKIEAPYHDFMASCIVWNPPGLGYSVVVIGSGERSMHFWEPLKVIYKSTLPEDKAYEAARSSAVMFVMNNMLYLSDTERNRVRFSEAEVVRTEFNLKYMLKQEPADASSWESYLSSLAEDNKTQYSLIWKGDDDSHFIVIAGYASGSNTLAGWSPMSGMRIDKSKLERFSVRASAEAGKTVPQDPSSVGKGVEKP